MGSRIVEQVGQGKRGRAWGRPKRRQPVPDSPGGGRAPRRRTYFQAQLRLHFSRKTRAQNELSSARRQRRGLHNLAGGEAETRARPASPPPRAAGATHLPLHLQAQPVRDLPDLVDVGEHLIVCAETQTRPSRCARGPGPTPFPAPAGRTRPLPLPGALRSRPRRVPRAPTPSRSRKGRWRPPGPRQRQRRRPSPAPTPSPRAAGGVQQSPLTADEVPVDDHDGGGKAAAAALAEQEPGARSERGAAGAALGGRGERAEKADSAAPQPHIEGKSPYVIARCAAGSAGSGDVARKAARGRSRAGGGATQGAGPRRASGDSAGTQCRSSRVLQRRAWPGRGAAPAGTRGKQARGVGGPKGRGPGWGPRESSHASALCWERDR